MNGREGLRALTTQKAVLADRFPVHVPTQLYPVKPHDYAVTSNLIQLIYRRGFVGKIELATDTLPAGVKLEGATILPDADITGYSDDHVQSTTKHPMQALYGYHVAAELQPGCRYDDVVKALKNRLLVEDAPLHHPGLL